MLGFVSKREYDELKARYDRLLELNKYFAYWYARAIDKNWELAEKLEKKTI